MKIFSWVHRKFSNKGEYGKNRNGSINISTLINEEKHCYNFDLHDDNDDVDDDNTTNNYFEYHVSDQHWSSGGGILTVGTFGHDDPLIIRDHVLSSSSFYEEYDRSITSRDNDGVDNYFEEEEKEKVHPLVLAAYNHGEDSNNNKKNSYKRSMRRRGRKDRLMTDEFECRDRTYVMMEKKERITLGDLLSHDDDELKLNPINNTNINSTTFINDPVTINKLLASNYNYLHYNKYVGRNNNNKNKKNKKKKQLIADEARPTRKLQQMMRRMLKRKIHPDCIDSKISQRMMMRNWNTNDEYASLLPIQ